MLLLKIKVPATLTLGRVRLQTIEGSSWDIGQNLIGLSLPGNGQNLFFMALFHQTSQVAHLNFFINIAYENVGTVTEFTEFMFLNLTRDFEEVELIPTKDKLEEYLTKYPNGWFDGTDNMFNAQSSKLKTDILVSDVDVLNSAFELNATNLNTNDFITSGWTGRASTTSFINGVLTCTGDGTQTYIGGHFSGSVAFSSENVRVIYAAVLFKVLDDNCKKARLIINDNLGRQLTDYPILLPVANKEYRISERIITTRFVGALCSARLQCYYEDNATASGKIVQLRKGILLDLTAIFGAGNEPTNQEMDSILKAKFTDGCFFGTQNIFSAKGLTGVANKGIAHRGAYAKINIVVFFASSIVQRMD